MGNKVQTEKDLSVEEKKVFGRIIDLWVMGSQQDPYAFSTERKVIKYSEQDGLSNEKILKILKDLETRRFIHRAEEKGEIHIKYRVESEHIVKELQKTSYVHGTEKFKPPHH